MTRSSGCCHPDRALAAHIRVDLYRDDWPADNIQGHSRRGYESRTAAVLSPRAAAVPETTKTASNFLCVKLPPAPLLWALVIRSPVVSAAHKYSQFRR